MCYVSLCTQATAGAFTQRFSCFSGLECSVLCRTKQSVPATPPTTPQDSMSSNYWRPVGQSQGNQQAQQTQQDRNPLRPSINSATKEVASYPLLCLAATSCPAAAAALIFWYLYPALAERGSLQPLSAAPLAQ